ncbi:DEAD/DEAH box helicase [Nocardia sp. NPDC046763]|uniref:DEAD/DEAH box helicase n=1 Tax=Nocardia sp. NPDC046763 TaxID=3155256 RepID=UPI00340C6D46
MPDPHLPAPESGSGAPQSAMPAADTGPGESLSPPLATSGAPAPTPTSTPTSAREETIATDSSPAAEASPTDRGVEARRRTGARESGRDQRDPAGTTSPVDDHAGAGSEGGEVRFADLGLPPVLVQALRRGGIDKPFPIQAAVIPDILDGRDVLGRAATGSGKTLAFGLPMLVRLFGAPSAPRRPRGLILAPTRELAIQIESALDDPALSLGLRLATAVGGLPIKKQEERLARGVDIVIATPGRLTDLLGRKAVQLGDIRVVTVDEADHMAELGFLPQLTALLNKVPGEAQQLLFSATLDETVDGLVQKYLREPATHAIGAVPAAMSPEPVDATVSGADSGGELGNVAAGPDIAHYALHVRRSDKRAVVSEIAARQGRTLLFVRTQHGADKLARKLREIGIGAVALHGGKAQNQRNRMLAAFADGTAPVLVATDVAARGLHIDDVSLVVHVDPPADPKDYLHRTGRTARAGASGTVVTIVTPDDREEAARLAERASVTLTDVEVRPGDRRLLEITGARRPSGRPVADPSAPPAPAAEAPREQPRFRQRPKGESRPHNKKRKPGVARRSSR